MSFEMGWNHPAGVLGWMNMDRMQVLATRLSACDCILSQRQDYEMTAEQSLMYFDPMMQADTSSPQIRFPFIKRKDNNPPFTIQYWDAPPADSAATTGQGLSIHSMSYETQLLPHLSKLSDFSNGTPLSMPD